MKYSVTANWPARSAWLSFTLLLSISFCLPANAESVAYSYDALNRLIQANYGGGRMVIGYTYDAAGNRTIQTVSSLSPTLSVTVTGSGSVTSVPPGIACPSGSCSGAFDTGTQVSLTAEPAAGWEFNGWSGACSGTGGCSVLMSEDRAVTATFVPQPLFTLRVTVNGFGSVVSEPSGIDCPGASCSADFAGGTPVTLFAAGSNGSRLRSWAEDCSGSQGCSLSMSEDRSVTANFGMAVAGDFDGDFRSDMTVWRSDAGIWFSRSSADPESVMVISWGLASDIAVPGDYDGDGRMDIAVWRPSAGMWFILPSDSPDEYTVTQWGANGDVPLPGDYDGDGRTDLAVWRPDNGVWFALLSGEPGGTKVTQWGIDSDIPVTGDYDGDGKTDIAVWRPSAGMWFILPSQEPESYTATQWGIPSDIPVPGDYDGDGTNDIAVWRPDAGMWFIKPSATPGQVTVQQWGSAEDLPVAADYDGDGITDIAVWRPSAGMWFIQSSQTPGAFTVLQWGADTDVVISPTGILRSLW